MSKYWKSANKVKCPLYEGERDKCIVCTGYMCPRVQWIFSDAEEKHEYMRDYCYKYPNTCIHLKTTDNLNNSPIGKDLA